MAEPRAKVKNSLKATTIRRAVAAAEVGSLTSEDIELALQTDAVLASLTPREEKILRMRFGIKGASPRLLEIQRAAEERLRADSRAKHARNIEPIEPLDQFSLNLTDLRTALEEVKEITPELIVHLKRHEKDLEKVPPDVFEHLIGEFFSGWGHSDVRLVGRDPKTQADVVAIHQVEPSGIRLRYFIEAKRTRDRVGIEVINQVHGAFSMEQPRHGWTIAMIVSLAGYKDFHRFSKEDLENRNLYLRDGNDVRAWLRSYQFGPNGLWLPNPIRSL